MSVRAKCLVYTWGKRIDFFKVSVLRIVLLKQELCILIALKFLYYIKDIPVFYSYVLHWPQLSFPEHIHRYDFSRISNIYCWARVTTSISKWWLDIFGKGFYYLTNTWNSFVLRHFRERFFFWVIKHCGFEDSFYERRRM